VDEKTGRRESTRLSIQGSTSGNIGDATAVGAVGEDIKCDTPAAPGGTIVICPWESVPGPPPQPNKTDVSTDNLKKDDTNKSTVSSKVEHKNSMTDETKILKSVEEKNEIQTHLGIRTKPLVLEPRRNSYEFISDRRQCKSENVTSTTSKNKIQRSNTSVEMSDSETIEEEPIVTNESSSKISDVQNIMAVKSTQASALDIAVASCGVTKCEQSSMIQEDTEVKIPSPVCAIEETSKCIQSEKEDEKLESQSGSDTGHSSKMCFDTIQESVDSSAVESMDVVNVSGDKMEEENVQELSNESMEESNKESDRSTSRDADACPWEFDELKAHGAGGVSSDHSESDHSVIIQIIQEHHARTKRQGSLVCPWEAQQLDSSKDSSSTSLLEKKSFSHKKIEKTRSASLPEGKIKLSICPDNYDADKSHSSNIGACESSDVTSLPIDEQCIPKSSLEHESRAITVSVTENPSLEASDPLSVIIHSYPSNAASENYDGNPTTCSDTFKEIQSGVSPSDEVEKETVTKIHPVLKDDDTSESPKKVKECKAVTFSDTVSVSSDSSKENQVNKFKTEHIELITEGPECDLQRLELKIKDKESSPKKHCDLKPKDEPGTKIKKTNSKKRQRSLKSSSRTLSKKDSVEKQLKKSNSTDPSIFDPIPSPPEFDPGYPPVEEMEISSNVPPQTQVIPLKREKSQDDESQEVIENPVEATTVSQPEPDGSAQADSLAVSDIPPLETPEVCPWEDEENCRTESHSPFVKLYATLGYL
jgi:hypothetical protein